MPDCKYDSGTAAQSTARARRSGRRLPYLTTNAACFGLLAAVICGPAVAEDRWKHFENGGMFITASPSLLPDGRSLVFASACTGHGDIYIIENGACDPVRLTTSEEFESSPVFTSNGKQIVYIRERTPHRHVWMMDSDGSNERQLTDGNSLDDLVSVSHDGRYLLFNRSTGSGGFGRIVRAFLLRIDEPTAKPVSVGDVAVLSPNSKWVIYRDAGALWRLDIDGKKDTRRRLYGRGSPLDASEDGKLILAAPRAAVRIDHQIWVLNEDERTEKQVARGHSAILCGPERQEVLFFVGYDHTPYVTTIGGDDAKQIDCPSTSKTYPRTCMNGRGAVVAAFERTGSPNYSVIYLDPRRLRSTSIAAITCSGVTFNMPPEATLDQE